LVSFLDIDVDAALERLGALGFEPIGRIEGQSPTHTFDVATVRDPDGVIVELVGTPRPR
jgi:hypothetical protein